MILKYYKCYWLPLVGLGASYQRLDHSDNLVSYGNRTRYLRKVWLAGPLCQPRQATAPAEFSVLYPVTVPPPEGGLVYYKCYWLPLVGLGASYQKTDHSDNLVSYGNRTRYLRKGKWIIWQPSIACTRSLVGTVCLPLDQDCLDAVVCCMSTILPTSTGVFEFILVFFFVPCACR